MTVLQMKKEFLQKLSRAMASAVCLLSLVLMAAGCGKVEEPIPVQFSSGKVEELQNDAVGEIEDDPKEVSDGEPNVDIDKNAEGDTEDSTAEKVGQDDSSNENVQQPEETQPQSVGNAELEGNVKSIGTDSFVVVRHEVWTDGNASYAVGAASGYEDEENRITVHVNQNCVWEFETVKNGGINPEDVSTREGSFADLQEGIAISIKGSWQGDESFLADNIVMMIFA